MSSSYSKSSSRILYNQLSYFLAFVAMSFLWSLGKTGPWSQRFIISKNYFLLSIFFALFIFCIWIVILGFKVGSYHDSYFMDFSSFVLYFGSLKKILFQHFIQFLILSIALCLSSFSVPVTKHDDESNL